MATQNSQDQFYNWLALWDKAVKEDPNFSEKTESKANKGESFFGVLTESKNPSVKSDPKNPDAGYWNLLINLTEKYGIKNSTSLINDYLENKLQEDTKADFKKVAKAVSDSPNKVKPDTVGSDQDLDNLVSLGATYTPEDIEELTKMKEELNELILKVQQMEFEGKNSDSLKKSIDKLNDKIDELSTRMGKTVPEST